MTITFPKIPSSFQYPIENEKQKVPSTIEKVEEDIEFIKNHPSGIKSGSKHLVGTKLGERMVSTDFANQIDLEEFNAMIYQAVVNGLTFSAEAAGEMHRRIYIITYTGGY